MNINLNDFIPALCEPSLKKIYKDLPGWQVKSLPVEHMRIVDFWGNPTTISITRRPYIDIDCFDGFGVIRNKVDKDGDYPFLAPDPVGFISDVLSAANARKTTKSTRVNEKKLNETIKMFDIDGTRHKYLKYIDIILEK